MHRGRSSSIQFKSGSYKSYTTIVRYSTLTPNTVMADTEELPGYTLVAPEWTIELGPPPPDDNTDFTIGSQRVSRPLVSTEQLKSHLRLLGMFALMKQKVEDPDSDPQVVERIPPLAKDLPPEWRWVWFLELAVERYVSDATPVFDESQIRADLSVGLQV